MKAMTIRLDDGLAEELEIFASVRESSVTEVIRESIQAHLWAQRTDPEFQSKVRERIARTASLLSPKEGHKES